MPTQGRRVGTRYTTQIERERVREGQVFEQAAEDIGYVQNDQWLLVGDLVLPALNSLEL